MDFNGENPNNSFSGDVDMDGDLDVVGTITADTVQADTGSFSTLISDIDTEDAIILLAKNNPSDAFNMGIKEEYISGSQKWSGLIRSKDDKKQYLFEGSTTKPLPATDITSFPLGTLKLNKIEANNVEVQTSTGASKISIDAPASSDSILELKENNASLWEVKNLGGFGGFFQVRDVVANRVRINIGSNSNHFTSESGTIYLSHDGTSTNLRAGGFSRFIGSNLSTALYDETGILNINLVSGQTELRKPVLVSATGGTIEPSSILEIKSTTKGFLPPRMTTTERNAIVGPVQGMMIYNTTTDRLNLYDGSLGWQPNGDISNGGNSLGVNIGVGTNDAFDLNLKSNNLTRLSLKSGGDVVIANACHIGSTSAPDSTAVLELTSTTKGILFPRLTTAQRDAIISPPGGLEIFNTDTNDMEFYTGSVWMGSVGGNPFDQDLNTTDNPTFAGLTINTLSGILIDSPNTAVISIDRNANTNFNNLNFLTAGVNYFSFTQEQGNDTTLLFRGKDGASTKPIISLSNSDHSLSIGDGATNYKMPTARPIAPLGKVMVETSAGVLEFKAHIHSDGGAPLAGDDVNDGFLVGSLWVNTTIDVIYVCVDNSAGSAVWKVIVQKDSNTLTNLDDTQFGTLADDDFIQYDLALGKWVNIPDPTANKVVGPGSATNNAICVYNGTTGKLIKDSDTEITARGDVVQNKSKFGGVARSWKTCETRKTVITVANTTTQVPIINCGNYPGSYFAVGDGIRFRINGKISSSSGSRSIQARLILFNTTVSSGFVLPDVNMSNKPITIDGDLIFHAVGVSGVAYGFITIRIQNGTTANDVWHTNIENVSVDTTRNGLDPFEVRFHWDVANASNTASFSSGYLEYY